MARGASELDPRRPDQHHLAAHREHVWIFDPAERARPKAGACYDGVDGILTRATRGEDVRAALGDLAQMLHRAADDDTAFGEEAREEVVAVDGGVDCDCCKRDAVLRTGEEGILGEWFVL